MRVVAWAVVGLTLCAGVPAVQARPRVSVAPALLLEAVGPGASEEAVLGSLTNDDPELQRLRQEIAENLKSVARGGGLRRNLRVVRYRVRPGENFYAIMAKVSQDADTLASINGLANPNALRQGDVLRIPNARGLFVERANSPTGAAELAREYEIEKSLVQRFGQLWFLPGQKFRPKESEYFRGEGFGAPLRVMRVSSGFGLRRDPFTRRATFHGGVDIAAPTGTPVYASRAGRVVRASRNAAGYGRLVVVEHEFGYQTYYGHLSKILVKKGQTVEAGTVLGEVGATGRATGPHLHFEVRKNGILRRPTFVHGVEQ